MNKKEAIVVGAILLAGFVGSVFADSVATAPNSSSGCNTKCLIDSLQKPVVSGNFTVVSGCVSAPFVPQCPLAYPQGGFVAVIAGGVSNYGTRTALNVNMTLYWTITYPPGGSTGTIQQNLGTFDLGRITGRTTLPFSHLIPVSQSPLPFTVDVVNATFVWNGT